MGLYIIRYLSPLGEEGQHHYDHSHTPVIVSCGCSIGLVLEKDSDGYLILQKVLKRIKSGFSAHLPSRKAAIVIEKDLFSGHSQTFFKKKKL